MSVLFGLGTAIGSGCTSNPIQQPSSVARTNLLVLFASPRGEEAMSRALLKEPFIAYWQAHIERDWRRRFSLERLTSPLEERFYVAYHANAWKLKRLQVLEVAATANAAIVSVAFTWIDPENEKEVVRTQKDEWILTGTEWRHVISDPMLSGFKQQTGSDSVASPVAK